MFRIGWVREARQAWRVAARIGLARQAGRGGGVRERRGEGRLGLAGGVG